jgi:hypothetical protein
MKRNGWPRSDTDYIFADENGKPYRDVREAFNTLIRKARIEFATNEDHTLLATPFIRDVLFSI